MPSNARVIIHRYEKGKLVKVEAIKYTKKEMYLKRKRDKQRLDLLRLGKLMGLRITERKVKKRK